MRYFYATTEPRLAHAASYIRSLLKRGALVDIGCNTGNLVAILRGWGLDAIGFDTDPQAIAEGQRLNRPVHIGDVREAGLIRSKITAVSFNHTLEHVVPVGETLRAACNLLRNGGQLFLFVPNIASLRATLKLETGPP